MPEDLRGNRVNDVFPYNVHIRKEFLLVSVGIIFLNLSFSNILGMKRSMVRWGRCIVSLNNIVSFSQLHQIWAYPYNEHTQNNHHDSMVHTVYIYRAFGNQNRSIDDKKRSYRTRLCRSFAVDVLSTFVW